LTFLVNQVYLCFVNLVDYFSGLGGGSSHGSVETLSFNLPVATENTSNVRTLVIRVVLVALLGAGVWYGISAFNHARHHETTDNAQIETYLVPVLPRLAGYVKTVNVKDYDPVKNGQLLAEIDVAEGELALTELEASYQQAIADVETARATLRNTQLTIQSSDANLKLA